MKKLTPKQEQLKKVIKPLVEQILRENSAFSDAEIAELSKKCNYNTREIADLFLAVLKNSNQTTLVKYLERFFNDLQRNGNRIEGTLLYKNAGY